MAFVLRVYSFVFHLTLSSFLLGVAAIAAKRREPVSLSVLPFPDEEALRDLAVIGSLGVLCALLALTRSFKWIFVLWTLLILYLMLKGFFFGPYAVAGTEDARGAGWVTLGALGACLGAVLSLKTRQRRSFI